MNIDELQLNAERNLDQYEKLSGLPEFNLFDSAEVSKYFEIPIEQLNKLTSIECANAAYLLAQYSFYIQRLYNRENAKYHWALSKLNEYVCDKIGSYDKYTKNDYKIALISKENKAVEKLRNIINHTTQIMERLSFLSTSVKNMCEIMSNIQKAKSFQHKVIEYE